MDQLSMFTLGVESLQIGATWTWATGWRLRVACRRQGEPWSAAHLVDYEGLSVEELAQVLTEELYAQLGLGHDHTPSSDGAAVRHAHPEGHVRQHVPLRYD